MKSSILKYAKHKFACGSVLLYNFVSDVKGGKWANDVRFEVFIAVTRRMPSCGISFVYSSSSIIRMVKSGRMF
jgi:hypothetical protein